MKFTHKIQEFAREIRDALPPAVVETAILGGGALRSLFDDTVLKDVDLFFPSQEAWQEAVKALALDELVFESTSEHPVFSIGGHRVELVGFRFTDSARELAESFDFRCCAMAVRLRDLEAFVVDGAVADCYDMELRINKPNPLRRLITRAARYIEYGYRIGDDFKARVPECINATGDKLSESY